MTRTSLVDFNCSLARTADFIGDKWCLLIIRDAFYGVSTFSEFQSRLGLSKTVLSDRLQLLLNGEILCKERTRPDIERYRYKLTPRGRDLFTVIVALVQWGDKWIFGAESEPVLIKDKESSGPIQPVVVQSRKGKFLKPSEVFFQPGPGASEHTLELFEKFENQE